MDKEYEDRKQRCLEKYNKYKQWKDKIRALELVSCLCNVDFNTLKDWVEEME